jgi:hypothetical protein
LQEILNDLKSLKKQMETTDKTLEELARSTKETLEELKEVKGLCIKTDTRLLMYEKKTLLYRQMSDDVLSMRRELDQKVDKPAPKTWVHMTLAKLTEMTAPSS